MWLRRTKSTTPFEHRSLPPFSCSPISFKDVQTLLDDDTNNNTNSLSTPNSPSLNVFHRVRSAKSLLRALSRDLKTDENQLQRKKPPKSDNGVVLNALKRGFSEGNKCFVEDLSSLGGVVDVKEDVQIQLPGTETRVVIFFTSLRVVRGTFEDCKYVRSILHSFPVAIDERDLFMDVSFIKDLQGIMGKDEKTFLTLPRVFIGGRYFGGAEEIRQIHEAGELKKYLQGLAPKPPGTCEVCFGHGFILCVECNGSHKCYVDKGGFKTCTGCNENGLVRCSSCSSAPL